jgi:hypothetical protein
VFTHVLKGPMEMTPIVRVSDVKDIIILDGLNPDPPLVHVKRTGSSR